MLKMVPNFLLACLNAVALIKPLDFALVAEEESEAANSKINQLARPLAHSLSNLDGLVSRQA
jgi:hypothetical protein